MVGILSTFVFTYYFFLNQRCRLKTKLAAQKKSKRVEKRGVKMEFDVKQIAVKIFKNTILYVMVDPTQAAQVVAASKALYTLYNSYKTVRWASGWLPRFRRKTVPLPTEPYMGYVMVCEYEEPDMCLVFDSK